MDGHGFRNKKTDLTCTARLMSGCEDDLSGWGFTGQVCKICKLLDLWMISLDIFKWPRLGKDRKDSDATVFEGLSSEKSSKMYPTFSGNWRLFHRQLRSDLAARAPRFFFGGTRGLQAVQKLLQETRDKVQLVLQWMTWRYTLWWSTGAMENHPFLDEFPIFKGAGGSS